MFNRLSVYPRYLLLGLACLLNTRVAWSESDNTFAAAREALVQRDIIPAGITNSAVIEAVRKTPRHRFVPSKYKPHAYYDMGLPLGYGQTISSPYIVAFMTEQLEPKPTDRVLEIGTGSGYQAAILSGLVKDVYTIEIVEALGLRAARVLRKLKLNNVHTRIGDGYQGWSSQSPFNKIIVTCSPENVPQPLIDQLAEGGRLIVPVGQRFQQTLVLFSKQEGQLVEEPLKATFFVPMTGTAEDRRQVFPSDTNPRIEYGSFEASVGESNYPIGWYYVRQANILSDASAPDGERYLVFSNQTAGRPAHALHAFGVDGKQVRQLQLSLWARGRDIRPTRSTGNEAGCVFVWFYGPNRSMVGDASPGIWKGSFDWQQKRFSIAVPRAARLGVVAIGLFATTGEAAFDDVVISAKPIVATRRLKRDSTKGIPE